MFMKYKLSPVVEAICEFQFEPEVAWDLAALGLVYNQIKDRFPIRNQVAQVSASVPKSLKIVDDGHAPLMQFIQEERDTCIQVGKNSLTINQIKSYTSWDNFQPHIENALQAYVTAVKPKKLSRIALRYVCRVVLSKGARLEDYFRFYPTFEQGRSEDFQTFLVGIELPVEAIRGVAHLKLGTTGPNKGETQTIMLDLSFAIPEPEAIDFANVLEPLNTVHSEVEKIFDACITDKLRREFQGEL